MLEKVSRWRGNMIERGAIVCFNPPASVMGKELDFDLPHILSRLTGLPMFPADAVYIKRIVGVADDRIRVEANLGVFVNDELLQEPYVAGPPNYSLSTLSDIGGRAVTGALMHPYEGKNEPIVVPKGMLFVLGDDRNNSEDSHTWGFLSEDRVIGRTWLLYSPIWHYIHQPRWTRPAEAPGSRQY